MAHDDTRRRKARTVRATPDGPAPVFALDLEGYGADRTGGQRRPPADPAWPPADRGGGLKICRKSPGSDQRHDDVGAATATSGSYHCHATPSAEWIRRL